jgi:hypothetical protein
MGSNWFSFCITIHMSTPWSRMARGRNQIELIASDLAQSLPAGAGVLGGGLGRQGGGGRRREQRGGDERTDRAHDKRGSGRAKRDTQRSWPRGGRERQRVRKVAGEPPVNQSVPAA